MDRIRQLRKEQGLSQAKLAVMADMDPATLNRLEQGKGNPNLKTLERVAEALGVEVVDLLGKARARSSSQARLFNGNEEEQRADQLEQVEQAARALNAAWVRELHRDEFTVEEYDEAGRGLYGLDALLAETMTEEFIRDEEAASEAYRDAWHRAWQVVDELRRTLQRAHDALEARGVSNLNEYRESRASRSAPGTSTRGTATG